MTYRKTSFVLITRVPNLRFSLASVATVRDIDLEDHLTLSAFLYDQIEADDLEALAILDAKSIPIASLWTDKIQDQEGDEVSAVVMPPGGGAQHFFSGNLVITGPGDPQGNLTFLHPSRAYAFADALNASERVMLGPNAFMQTCGLPMQKDRAWRDRRAS